MSHRMRSPHTGKVYVVSSPIEKSRLASLGYQEVTTTPRRKRENPPEQNHDAEQQKTDK